MSRTKNTLKKRRNTETKAHKPSYTILALAVFMALFGLTMIFSASIYHSVENTGNQYYYLILQGSTMIISLIPAALIYFWDYRKMAKLTMPALIVIIGLLIAVLLSPESARNGSARWFDIGGIQIQPSEFLKPVIVMYAASWLSKQSTKGNRTTSKEFLAKLARFMAIPAFTMLLILAEPDLGTTMLIAATIFTMFYISGSDATHTMGSIGVGVVVVLIGIIAAVASPYRLERVTTFASLFISGEVADPQDSGYQVQQILIGLGNGGPLGKGLGKSTQKNGFLVEATSYTDSTLAVMQEELGYASLVIFVIFWLIILWKGIDISLKAPDRLGQLTAAGLTIYLTLQAFLNMGANNIVIPLTGIPLPFLTYGGSSILVTMCSFALLLNISRYTENG